LAGQLRPQPRRRGLAGAAARRGASALTMQRSRILAAAVVAALSLSACGNGAGPDATQGGTLQDAPTDAAVAAGNAAAAGEVANGGGAGAETGHTALDRYPDAQRTCLEEVA